MAVTSSRLARWSHLRLSFIGAIVFIRPFERHDIILLELPAVCGRQRLLAVQFRYIGDFHRLGAIRFRFRG